MIDREQILFNFYRLQRRAGSCPVDANEEMLAFSKRLDAAQQRAADDAFNRDVAVLRAVMERRS